MLAMFRKDLRELAKWAALILLAMAAAIVLARYGIGNRLVYRFNSYMLSAAANATSSIGCAAGGLLLGLMATMFEARRDAWGFLIHRPTTRNRLFAGKALAAIVLLWLAAGIPLAASLWWESNPNRRSTPFAWSMGLGNLADLLAGTAYVFCGMAIGVRGARWYGSRVLPVAGGLLASAVTYLFPDFLPAAGAVLVTLAIAAAAAWGVFVAGGQDASTPQLGKAGLGFCVHAALAPMMLLAAAFLMTFVVEPLSQPATGVFPIVRYDVDQDGRVYRVTDIYSRAGLVSSEVTDAQGQPLPGSKQVTRDDKQYADRLAQFTWIQLPPLKRWDRYLQEHYRSPLRYYSPCVVYDSNEDWVFDNVSRRIEAYDARLRKRLGTLGANGFVDARHGLAQPFADAAERSSPNLIVFPTAAYRLNGKSRQLEKLFSAPEGERIAKAQITGTGTYGQSDFVGAILAITERAAYINEFSGKPLVRLPESLWRGSRYLKVAQMPQARGWLVMVDGWPGIGNQAGSPPRLWQLDAQGKQVSALELPPLPSMARQPEPAGTSAVFGLLITPATAAGGALFVYVVAGEEAFSEQSGSTPFFQDPRTRGFLTWMAGALVTAAAASWWIGMRYGFSRRRRIAWAAASLFLGWAGVLLLLCLNQGVARRKCHACGKQRMVTHELCEHCGSPWDAAQCDGTEIMEEMPAVSMNESAALPAGNAG